MSIPRLAPCLSLLALFAPELCAAMDVFRDPDAPVENRIDDLLNRMTVEEKIDCLDTRPDVPRLGVLGSPHIEGYHGVAQGGPSNWGRRNSTPTTQFPQAYGLGATWDPELIAKVAAVEAEEARYLFQHPKYQRAGLVVRAPNADLARDPRWGRTEEVFGEDAYHVGSLTTAFVRGLQGDDPRYWKTAALLKHFLANSHEDDRTRSSSDFDERLWREYYAKPFEMAIVGGGAQAVMAAYNAVNGTPAHVHPMWREIVAREWGLDGIICTDGGGLGLLVTDHKAFPDWPTAAAACLKSGINQFLDRQKDAVKTAMERGLVTESDLDAALRGVFRVMIRLGLLDPAERVPYRTIGAADEIEPWNRPERRAFAREVTRRSMVLLKNSGNLLPFDQTKLKRVAVVGPHANHVLLDWYSGTPPYAISPRVGIEVAGESGPRFSVKWAGDMSSTAVELARASDVAVVCVGNHPEGNAGWETVTSPSEGKEAVDRREIVLQPEQEEFVRLVHAANPRTVVVLISSFPYALPWIAEHAPAILHVTHASQELGNALADVLLGVANPGGKLSQTWVRSLDQLPPMRDYDLRRGRTYMYLREDPLYAFGYGLSYTSFSLREARIDRDRLESGGRLAITVNVQNSGTRDGDEVVQIYARYPGSNVGRPKKQLVGFRRVSVGAGEMKMVTIEVHASTISYWDVARRSWALEPGAVELLVSTSSREQDVHARLPVAVAP